MFTFFSHPRHNKNFTLTERRLCYDKLSEGAKPESLSHSLGEYSKHARNTLDVARNESANFLRGVFDGLLKNEDPGEKRKAEMISKLQDFTTKAPSALVKKIADSVEALEAEKITLEELENLMSESVWIEAFNAAPVWKVDESKDFYDTEQTANNLLLTLPLEERKAIYEEYVRGFIPPSIQEKHQQIFDAANTNANARQDALVQNRDTVLGSMRGMLGGDLPKDDKEKDNIAYEIAFESLEDRYKADPGFTSGLLMRDAKHAAEHPSDPSFYKGYQKLQVNPDALYAVSAELKKVDQMLENVSTTVVDRKTKLDASIFLRESKNIAGQMESWEKLVLIGLAAVSIFKFPKIAGVGFLTYLGLKYFGGIKDPLGSGVTKVKEFFGFVSGTNEDVKASLGWNHDKTPEEVAKIMARFASGEDLQNMDEEVGVLVELNSKTMAELATAYRKDDSGNWTLDLETLYGGRDKIPPYFKKKDHRVAMTQAVGYLLFSRYRSSHPGDPDVKIIADRMAGLKAGESWSNELKKNPTMDYNFVSLPSSHGDSGHKKDSDSQVVSELAYIYDNLIFKGKGLAADDSRQLHKFVEDQVGIVDPVARIEEFKQQKIALFAALTGPQANLPFEVEQKGDAVFLTSTNNVPAARIPLSQFVRTNPTEIWNAYIAWSGDTVKQQRTKNPLDK